MDSFSTIASASEGIYKDKGSKFLAFAYPVDSEEEVKEKVDNLRKKYFDARHCCYAYRLGADGERYRANDDGEPANSAGKPILGQLVAHDVTNVLVVVVRYFGGILLGVGGLVQAYRLATADALANAEIITGTVTETYTFTFGYPDMNRVLKVVKGMNLEYYGQDFNLDCTMSVKVRKSLAGQMKKQLEPVESLKITIV
ncbi:MAG: YigZ family protein [Bacteroidales bacterium]|nr:YigZ family protein [Bacteroidales bacterium]